MATNIHCGHDVETCPEGPRADRDAILRRHQIAPVGVLCGWAVASRLRTLEQEIERQRKHAALLDASLREERQRREQVQEAAVRAEQDLSRYRAAHEVLTMAGHWAGLDGATPEQVGERLDALVALVVTAERERDEARAAQEHAVTHSATLALSLDHEKRRATAARAELERVRGIVREALKHVRPPHDHRICGQWDDITPPLPCAACVSYWSAVDPLAALAGKEEG